jgi:tRNA(fMet)-specific endonuclease VapC
LNSRTRPRLLVDTDVLSLALRGDAKLNSRLLQHSESWAISAITAVELGRYARVAKSERIRQLTLGLLSDVWVVDFDAAAADEAAKLLASDELKSRPIGFADTLIAAHALSLGIPIVTNNDKHFQRVPRLIVQNWLQ